MLEWEVFTFVTLPIPEFVANLVTLTTLAALSRTSTSSISSVAFSARIAPLSGRSGMGFKNPSLVRFSLPVCFCWT